MPPATLALICFLPYPQLALWARRIVASFAG